MYVITEKRDRSERKKERQRGRERQSRNPEERKRKQAKKCWVSHPALRTVSCQMTLGMSRCHLFPLSGLSTYIPLTPFKVAILCLIYGLYFILGFHWYKITWFFRVKKWKWTVCNSSSGLEAVKKLVWTFVYLKSPSPLICQLVKVILWAKLCPVGYWGRMWEQPSVVDKNALFVFGLSLACNCNNCCFMALSLGNVENVNLLTLWKT